jgi:hypothetical protein
MANFIPPGIITTDGDYEINARPGREHLLTISGTWDGATVTLYSYDDASASYVAVTSGAFTANAEPRFIAPSDKIRLTMTNDGASTSLSISLTPIAKGQ